jgi:hypothetical protein
MTAVVVLALVGAGCDNTRGSGADTSSSTTSSTTTSPTDTLPRSTSDPGRPDLPTRAIDVDDGTFDSLETMTAAADVIVVGTVTAETSLGRPSGGSEPNAVEYLGLTISVETALKGGSVEQVRLGWGAYTTDDTGVRTAENTYNGIPVPHIGDQLVLYLRPVDQQFADLLGDFPTHAPLALDGVAFADDGIITITDASSPAPLRGKTVAQLGAFI